MNLQTWLTRIQTRGPHIAPGTGTEHVQIIDAKDVGRFVIHCIQWSLYGVFNLTGESLPFRAFLDACRSATGSDAEFVWIPEDFLHEQDPHFERFFPLWLSNKGPQGFFQINGDKAINLGLQRRSFQETAADVLQWYRERDGKLPTANGTAGHWLDPLSAEQEEKSSRDGKAFIARSLELQILGDRSRLFSAGTATIRIHPKRRLESRLSPLRTKPASSHKVRPHLPGQQKKKARSLSPLTGNPYRRSPGKGSTPIASPMGTASLPIAR